MTFCGLAALRLFLIFVLRLRRDFAGIRRPESAVNDIGQCVPCCCGNDWKSIDNLIVIIVSEDILAGVGQFRVVLHVIHPIIHVNRIPAVFTCLDGVLRDRGVDQAQIVLH